MRNFKKADCEAFLHEKYANYSEAGVLNLVSHVCELTEAYVDHADDNFLSELMGGSCYKFQQRYWEMFLYRHLVSLGYSPASMKKDRGGPDFQILVDNRVVWVEAVAPEPCVSILNYEEELAGEGAAFEPSDAYTFRYTNAFSEKLKIIERYINEGVINPDNEAVIIAINSGLLGKSFNRGFHGKSNYPYIVDITYGIGSCYAAIDPKSGDIVEEGIDTELSIFKTSGSPIEKAYFRYPCANIISAVMGSPARPEHIGMKTCSIEMVHNYKAHVPVPAQRLGCTKEHFVNANKCIETVTYL
jgi:hypothetical protein